MSSLNLLVGATNLIAGGVGLALALPLLRRRVPMNPLYGVRFARSFESDELWYAINEYGARRMIPWAGLLIAIGVAALFLPLAAVPGVGLALAFAPLLLVVPCLQSYRYARGDRIRNSKE